MDAMGNMNGFAMPPAPPMQHQPPPQIFGPYSNGLPNMDMSDMASQMFGDPASLLEDSNEAKRRRIARVGPSDVRYRQH